MAEEGLLMRFKIHSDVSTSGSADLHLSHELQLLFRLAKLATVLMFRGPPFNY